MCSVLGFAGVVVINLLGNSLDMGFKLIGEGFVLIAQLSYGISTVLINLFSRKVSPVVLSGTQFAMGGIVLTLIGLGMGGHLENVTTGGVVIIFIWQWFQQWHIHSGPYCLPGTMFPKLLSLDL